MDQNNTKNIFSPKQMEFIMNSTAKWNLAHGAVRSGKTECTLFRFMQACYECPDNHIYMIGHTTDTVYQNAIKLIFECPRFDIFKPFCTWFPSNTNRHLRFKDKIIKTIGAKDEGAIGQIQGKTFSLVYCDEMTLYPKSIIDMIDTRLSNPHSMGFASMNPTYPSHVLKEWIDKSEKGNNQYYSLHFSIDDNCFLPEDFKKRLKESLYGLFFKRNYLGMWCLADGAIFDFFDKDIYVVNRAPTAAEYFIAGIDYGSSNPFACVLIGINTGRANQTGLQMWVEEEFYWDPKRQRQKTNFEFAKDISEFLEPYNVKQLYIDPSASAFKIELRQLKIHCVDADNDVLNGIEKMTSDMKKGKVVINKKCVNLIREIEQYSWDSKQSEKGYDEPIKKNDHLIDALRYCLNTHKPITYDPYKEQKLQKEWMQNKYQITNNNTYFR